MHQLSTRAMNFFERMRLRLYLLLLGFVVLTIAFLSPLNIQRMGNDIQKQIDKQLLDERHH